MVRLSKKAAEQTKNNPESARRMASASEGQAPRFLLVSSISRGSQDRQLFGFNQGDAFHATRVSGFALPPPESSPYLLAAPAAYNRQFPDRAGVIITFDIEESGERVNETIENIALYPDLFEIPLLAFRVDYMRGYARLVAHRFGRAYELENYLLKRISHPDYLDEDTLVVICSDSRVEPPATTDGLPLAIRTLGAYVPAYDDSLEEAEQLNAFFKDWLSEESDARRIVVVVHGSFEGTGHSCGAGEASLGMEEVSGSSLPLVIETLKREAMLQEKTPPQSPEERALSIGSATLKNIKTYPAIKEADARGISHLEFSGILKMDTATNVISR
jgi:carbonic anhydrase